MGTGRDSGQTGPDAEIEETKRREKEEFEQKRAGEGPVLPIDVEEFRRTILQPCYTTGISRYTDNLKAFHEHILADGGWEGKEVLDYACGDGKWSVYFVLTGARRAVGFDLAASGIRRGRQRVEAQGLTDRIELMEMDATDLKFEDNAFEMVIGTAVLHHVMKYPGIFEELHRVMKPGAKAYFSEGLADFPLFRLWWKARGAVPQGDIPIFAKDVRSMTRMFSDVKIKGDNFLYSVKRLLLPGAPGVEPIRPGIAMKLVLRTFKTADDILFAMCPPLRRWGSFSYITLTK